MRTRSSSVAAVAAVLASLAALAPAPALAAPPPIVYTVRITAPDTQTAEVEATIPTGSRSSVDLMMAIWSPGFYRVEDYATRVRDLAARTPDGTALPVKQTQKNRWQVGTNGAANIVVSYRLACKERSVTTNWVSPELIVLNGAATFITLPEQLGGPHEVRLELPGKTMRAVTALDPAPDGLPNHYRAEDFDTLVDSPIVAGAVDVHDFEVDGRRHSLVDAGERGDWDGRRAAADLEKIVRETRRLWGFLPYKKYLFLNVFRPGGGGLEHKDSTLLTVNAARAMTPAGYRSWLSFVAHEYFHAFNVKRLRPIELGPFDYEKAPQTMSLWISEGFTSYYATLLLSRAGLADTDQFLTSMSSAIRQLQQAPGRLVQTLERSSFEVWTNSMSGINTDASRSVSYYTKGEVAGFLLDARVRHATRGRRSLDDVMKLAYKRYAGGRGFTPTEFREVADQVSGEALADWFGHTVGSTDELDYTETLEWFGLRFASPDSPDPVPRWNLEVREDATAEQKAHLAALLSGVPARG